MRNKSNRDEIAVHEASLINNLLSAAEKTAAENNVKKINKVFLSVGKLSNAMPDALLFAFEAMTQSGMFKGAKLVISEVPVVAACEKCGFEYEPSDFPYICPVCQSRYFKIIKGEDVYIESIDCDVNQKEV